MNKTSGLLKYYLPSIPCHILNKGMALSVPERDFSDNDHLFLTAYLITTKIITTVGENSNAKINTTVTLYYF